MDDSPRASLSDLDAVCRQIAGERDNDAEVAVFRGVLRCGRKAFESFNREGLQPADFTDPDHATLYGWCREKWERDTPTDMVSVYRGVRADRVRFRAHLFGPRFAEWLAEAFDSKWWPEDARWAVAEFADGRVDQFPQDLFLATVAARLVHVLAERRREMTRRTAALAEVIRLPLRAHAAQGTVRLFAPPPHTDEDDDVETQGPRR